jgi:flagellar hook-associated protein 3 FlgL
MRISHQSVAQRLLREISTGQEALSETQEKLASGKAISKPSDDPFGISRTLAARTDMDLGAQWQRNITVAEDDLGLSESLLTNLGDLMQRAQELAVQGANGALTGTARNQLGQEVSRLLTEAVAIGNSTFGGRYIFAGHQTGAPPFVEDVPGNPTVVNYVGDAGAIQREIGPGGETIQVNIVGSDLFGDVFTSLVKLRDDLFADDQTSVNADSGLVSSAFDGVIEQRGDIGAKMRQADVARTRLEDGELRLQTLIASYEEADLAESLVDLQMRDTALNAALGAVARTLDTSLLDFLR